MTWNRTTIYYTVLRRETGDGCSDDLSAIARMLRQDKADVSCLSSAQWLHYLGERDSVGASQRDNEQLLRIMGRGDLPAPRGSDEPMGKPWGGFKPKDSLAAQSWTMWDVALIEAWLDPSIAPQTQVTAPPENVQRKVWMYIDIDEEAMQEAFWNGVR